MAQTPPSLGGASPAHPDVCARLSRPLLEPGWPARLVQGHRVGGLQGSRRRRAWCCFGHPGDRGLGGRRQPRRAARQAQLRPGLTGHGRSGARPAGLGCAGQLRKGTLFSVDAGGQCSRVTGGGGDTQPQPEPEHVSRVTSSSRMLGKEPEASGHETLCPPGLSASRHRLLSSLSGTWVGTPRLQEA